MEIRVRRAEAGDLDGIEELYGRAGDAEEGRLDGSRWKRGVYPLRQDAQEGLEAGALYIAELDGQIAGSVIPPNRAVKLVEKACCFVTLSFDFKAIAREAAPSAIL